jgi:hypothetical protein
MLAVPAMASAADPLPDGFIAVVADSRMTWDDAKAFCQERGGKLPLIDGSESLTRNDANKPGTPVDGFGAFRAPWPAGLPRGFYWTGTVFVDSPFADKHTSMWTVMESNGEVAFTGRNQADTRNVVCVPK